MLKFLFWKASQFILTWPSWYWCINVTYVIALHIKFMAEWFRDPKMNWGELCRVWCIILIKIQFVMKTVWSKTWHNFIFSSSLKLTNVLLRLAVGQVSHSSLVSYGGSWAAILYGQCMVVVFSGVYTELLVVLKVRIWCEERGTPGVWALKRFGCVLPYTRSVVHVNICKILQLPRVHHLDCPPSQPLTLQQNPGGSCFGHDISQGNQTAINHKGFSCALGSIRGFPALQCHTLYQCSRKALGDCWE